MLFTRSVIQDLRSRIVNLENELKRTQDLRDADRQTYERRIEELVNRLLAKAGTPDVVVSGRGNSPEAVMDLDVFKDLDEESGLTDNRRGAKIDDPFAG